MLLCGAGARTVRLRESYLTIPPVEFSTAVQRFSVVLVVLTGE